MLAEPERDAIEVSDDLVTVSKVHKDVGKADVAGIEIRVATDSPVPVAFKLVEQFPEGVSMDDLAVHPQFSPEKWTVTEAERRMVYEDVVEADEEAVTLYGVLESKYDGLELFMGEPAIAVSQQVDPGTSSDGAEPLFRGGAASADSGAPASADGAIDVDRLLENGAESSDDADDPPAAAGSEPSADAGASGPLDAEPSDADSADADPSDAQLSDGGARPAGHAGSTGEPAPGPSPDGGSGDGTFVFERDGPAPADADADGASDEPAAEPASPVGSSGTPEPADGSLQLGNASVVTAFVDELERGELSEEQLATLRDALDLEPAESMRLRVSHLQSEVANLSAYADEFERFVDEEGSPTGVIEEFRGELERMAAQVDELSADVGDAAEERADLRDYVDELEQELDALRETHESNVGRLSSRIEDVAAESVDAEETAALREELEAERAWRRTVVRSLEALAENAADAEDAPNRKIEW